MAKITTSQMELIMSTVTMVFANTEKQAKTWSTKAPAVVFASIAIIIALLGTIGYFIVSTSIAPLLILLGILMPLLCFGIYQATATIDKVHREFHEYHEAVGDLLALLKVDTIDENLIASIRMALQKAEDESDDVCEIVDQLDMSVGEEAEELSKMNVFDTIDGVREAEPNTDTKADIIPVEEETEVIEPPVLPDPDSQVEDISIVV